LPQDLGLPRVLSQRRGQDGVSATVTVRDLSPQALQEAGARLDAQIECEGLGLEDIFLEIHA
jgi:hypothetical protein